jgi:sterol desaturase/sphingolipid hydroxylase (fatty acid hydroxylase superfamily)
MSWREGLLRFSSFWIFPTLAIGGIAVTHRVEVGSRLADLLWLIPAGLFIWTLLEYALHRFAFHRPIGKGRLFTLVSDIHASHHESPRDPASILVKPGFGLIVSAAIMAAILLLVRDPFRTVGLMSGIWAGFLYYEAVHYRVHTATDEGWLISQQRRAHYSHHYRYPAGFFGVTSSLWDRVFGTYGSGR